MLSTPAELRTIAACWVPLLVAALQVRAPLLLRMCTPICAHVCVCRWVPLLFAALQVRAPLLLRMYTHTCISACMCMCVSVCVQAVFDELCAMLDGGDPKKTELKKGKANVVMFVGLQGEPPPAAAGLLLLVVSGFPF